MTPELIEGMRKELTAQAETLEQFQKFADTCEALFRQQAQKIAAQSARITALELEVQAAKFSRDLEDAGKAGA